MSGGVGIERTPEQIERDIAQTRAALDRKIEELERRLSPREQWVRLRNRLRSTGNGNRDQYASWGAAAAVAAGSILALNGWRRSRNRARKRSDHARLYVEEATLTDLIACE